MRITDRPSHAWGSLGVGVGLIFGIASLVAGGHYKHTPWWAVLGIVLAVIFLLAGVFIFISPWLGKRTSRSNTPLKRSVNYGGIKLELVDEPKWELWRGKSWIVDVQVRVTNDTKPGQVITLQGLRLLSDPGSLWADRPRLDVEERTALFWETRDRSQSGLPMDLGPGESRIVRLVREAFLPYSEREGKPYCEFVMTDAERNAYRLPVTAAGSRNLPALVELRNLAMAGRPLREQIEGSREGGGAPSDGDQRLRYEDWTNRAGRALNPWPDLQAQFQADRTAASDRDPAHFVQRTELLEEMLRTLEARPRRDAERPRLRVPEAVQSRPVTMGIVLEADPPPPVRMSIVPEADGNRLRLLVRNRVARGMFKAEVTSVLDPDGRPAPGRQSWPIPWLDDGSVSPADLSQAEGRTLDFAWFEAGEGGWPDLASWRFPSLPEPVTVMYRPVHDKKELAGQRFLASGFRL